MPPVKERRLDRKTAIETEFNLASVVKELRGSSKIVANYSSDKIDLITNLVDCQIRLVGIYYSQARAKMHLDLSYDHNVLLANAVMNQPYQSLSILLLVKQTMFGSARALLRQFFEGVCIAKYSECDVAALARKWQDVSEHGGPEESISLSNDVFRKLKTNGIDVSALKVTWKRLNLYTHSTKYAQQIPRVSPAKNLDDENDEERREKIKQWTELEVRANTEFTLDLHFMLLCMNYHLLTSHWGRKTRRWYFGYEKDPYGQYRREKQLKSKHKALVQKYFEINKRNKGANKELKLNIRQYRQSWRSRTSES